MQQKKELIKQGLKINWKQFTLLLLVNAFVGGMVGLERSIFPEFAKSIFDVSAKTAIFSFIIAFGLAKAFANYFAGKFANYFGRRKLLLFGWLLAIPVPFLLIYAHTWNWVVFANVLLGISQGLTWSSTVVMKIDLVGEKERGFAMGLNEFTGYFAVGLVAFLTGFIADKYGVTPYPFYLGIGMAISGFLLTLFFVKDTRKFAEKETTTNQNEKLQQVFLETTFKNKTLSAVTQAGLVNNLNDGMIWGLLPVLMMTLAYDQQEIGLVAALYPAVWGIGQLFTGKMADRFSKKKMLFWGMLLQGVAILLLTVVHSLFHFSFLAVLIGLGTALVYPTFLTVIAQTTTPLQRAESIGTFRLWRDLGYAIGANISGLIADQFGVGTAIFVIGTITILSAWMIHIRMPLSIIKEKNCIEPEEIKREIIYHKIFRIIDVRTKEEYEKDHIPEAMHIPITQLQEKSSQLLTNKTYITTCNKGNGRSAAAAKILNDMGFKAVWLCGGNAKWRQQM